MDSLIVFSQFLTVVEKHRDAGVLLIALLLISKLRPPRG